jgi:hypothetical protein
LPNSDTVHYPPQTSAYSEGAKNVLKPIFLAILNSNHQHQIACG